MNNKKFGKRSLQFKIIVYVLLIILLFISLVSIFTINNFKRYVIDNASSRGNEISRQIVYNYENYITSIIESFNVCVEKLDNTDAKNNPQEVKDYFNDVLKYRTDITNITLFNIDGTLVTSTNDDFNPSSEMIRTMFWFQEPILQPTVHYFSPPYTDDSGENMIFVTKYLEYNFGKEKGVLMVELSSDKIINLSKNTNLGNYGQIIILNNENNLIFSSSEDGVTDLMLEKIKKLQLGTDIVSIDSNLFSLNINSVTSTRWKMAIFVNIDDSSRAINNFTITLIAISILAIILITVIVTLIARGIANPIKKLERAMKDIEESDFLLVNEVNVTGQKEIASLTDTFNLMMKRIKELMDKVVEEQISQRKSELKALQYQINPHFLYNTLDSIVWLIDDEKNAEASKMVVALAKLFRISISRGRNIITVKDEIEHARSYLLIQSIRYSNAFKYEFDIQDEVLECTTVKLILQPLIENAIYHGIKDRIEEGYIKVSSFIENDRIVFKIIDNGYGMKQEKIDAIYETFNNPEINDGVGVKNVYLRLKLYYGEQADLKIESELDEGTTITLYIPLKLSKGDKVE